MRIQTLSVVCGTAACDASCPFCVSRMTYNSGSLAPSSFSHKNFQIAIDLAKRSGVTTAMLTGKGEPTLWLEQVTYFVSCLNKHFPLIEIQTNGLGIGTGRVEREDLESWYRYGLTTVAISVVHWRNEVNQRIYSPKKEYPDLATTIKILHDVGLSVRLSCVMIKNHIDTFEAVMDMVSFASENEVEQLTFVPVNQPKVTKEKLSKPSQWAYDNRIYEETVYHIRRSLEDQGTLLMDLAHGARVFDYEGQNVCLSNCLGENTYTDKSLMRNLIYFPDGHLRYSWEHKGAIIL